MGLASPLGLMGLLGLSGVRKLGCVPTVSKGAEEAAAMGGVDSVDKRAKRTRCLVVVEDSTVVERVNSPVSQLTQIHKGGHRSAREGRQEVLNEISSSTSEIPGIADTPEGGFRERRPTVAKADEG